MRKKLLLGFMAGMGILSVGGFVLLPQLPPAHDHPHPPAIVPTTTLPTQPGIGQAESRRLTAAAPTPVITIGSQSVLRYGQETKEEGRVLTANGKRYPLRVYKTLAMPNDPAANQWWVNSTNLPAAWDQGVGSYTPTIAIIDTGFALQHEEFSGRWHINTGEQGVAIKENPSDLNCTDAGLPISAACNNIDDNFDTIVDNESGTSTIQNPSRRNCSDRNLLLDKSCNLIDDDGNSLKDDVTGWDFSNYDHNVQAGEVNPAGNSTTHGTMVAGIAGATGNNAKGIAGVNWSAKILPLQAIDDNGYGDTLTVARSIRYAADQKADIISLSLGTPFEDPYLREALVYALQKGSLVVAASGNDGCNCIIYPANYPEVIAVGANNSTGSPATFSNFGAQLDLLAPGQDMTTPTWSSVNQTSAYASGVAGTSFATPYVSGLLALAKSHQQSAYWGELAAAMLEVSDHRSSTPESPHSTSYGFGYVMADRLLTRVKTPAAPPVRFQFDTITPFDILDSPEAHQCASGGFPVTPLYELTTATEVRYSASKLRLHIALQNGWSARQAAYACSSLPFDAPASIRRLNLFTELRAGLLQKPL